MQTKMGNTNKDWQSNADTHKMSPEEVRKAGVESSKRPPGHNPGEVLHQRRRLPYSNMTMMIGGFFIVAAIGYGVLYYQSKPGTSPVDVAKATMTPDSPTGGDQDKKPVKTVQS
ncbi:hypothetical protein LUZ62_073717 [Rhynchospora pubera]|uniref:Transmembrane protein n=1 Tax=Rhynchospora pubera TaxID=906938 RepID=A0AAV8D4K2_9POAL|nr:hypothetical protein LUZ62_073717 [Rhynchospora pubera]